MRSSIVDWGLLRGRFGREFNAGDDSRAAMDMKNEVKTYSLGLIALVLLLVPPVSAPADTIYVSNYNDGTIDKVSSNGVVSVFATGLNHPMGLAFDSSGNLYVADSGNSQIVKFGPNGNPSVFASTGTEGSIGLAFDKSGNLYAALYGFNAIVEFTPSGSPFYSPFATSGVSAPTGLAFDQTGNLYVANTGNNTIEKFDANGHGTPFVTTGLNLPLALAFDSSGNLYVANADNHEIDEYDTNGNGSPFVSLGGGYVSGLAFDSAGNLYASFVGGANMIYKFNGSGAPSFVASGFNGPEFIAIQTVPEPETWDLLLTGLIASFSFHRQHRRRRCKTNRLA